MPTQEQIDALNALVANVGGFTNLLDLVHSAAEDALSENLSPEDR